MNSAQNTIRIAYLVAVHKNPLQVARLIKRLYYPGAYFFIHVSAKANISDYNKVLIGLPTNAIRFIEPRTRVRWGDFSLTKATLHGLAEILNSKLEPDFIFLMSGQDYPLTSNNELLSFLEKNSTRNFVHFHDISEPGSESLVQRINSYRFPIGKWRHITYPNLEPDTKKKRLVNAILKYSRLLPTNRPMPLDYKPYFGSNWLRIKPDAARYILKFLDTYPEFMSYFRYVLVPEEYIYQTILVNTPETALRESLYNDVFTYAHWDRPPEMYPVPLDMRDKDALIQSGKFFARKFDVNHNEEVLDCLDEHAGVYSLYK